MRLLALVSALLAVGCSGSSGANATSDQAASTTDTDSAAPAARRALMGFQCPEDGAAIPVAFFDADSTLRVSKVGAVTATSATDVDILPFAAPAIAALNERGFLVAIVSNQGGAAGGKNTVEVAEAALAFTARQLGRMGAHVDYFDLAEAYDDHRKPETGMARELDQRVREACGRGIDLGRSQMIGDSAYKKGVDGPSPDGRPADDFSNADRLFANNLGVRFEEPTDAFGWREYGVYNIATQEELVAFLTKMEAAAEQERSQGDAAKADAIAKEAASIRAIDGL